MVSAQRTARPLAGEGTVQGSRRKGEYLGWDAGVERLDPLRKKRERDEMATIKVSGPIDPCWLGQDQTLRIGKAMHVWPKARMASIDRTRDDVLQKHRRRRLFLQKHQHQHRPSLNKRCL